MSISCPAPPSEPIRFPASKGEQARSVSVLPARLRPAQTVVVGPAPRAGRGPPAQPGARSLGPRNRKSGADEDKGDDVGVITKQEYVCDYCKKTIRNADVLIGKLALRKRGARGLGREVVLALHPACSERLTDSTPARPVRRPRVKSAAAKPAEATKRTRVPAKASRPSRA